MKREEAIIRFERQLKAAQVVLDSGFGSNPGENDRLYRERKEMAEIAIAALRGPTREQVEKVWRGEWLNFYNDFSAAECSKCGELFEVSPDETPKEEFFKAFSGFYHFCPACGRAMTDEAVEMVMERLEALKDEID